MNTSLRINAIYCLHVPPDEAERRAQQLALEQSVEMPATSVFDRHVLDTMVARVESITINEIGSPIAWLSLSAETVGGDAGQLMNMLFGNCSLQPDVELIDIDLPDELALMWGGPNHGVEGMRRLTGADDRPLTCTALKPIGSTSDALQSMCTIFASAGIDVIKDDHGWADQRNAPFADRVRVCQAAVARANAERRHGHTLYAPSLYGHYQQMCVQIESARSEGVQAVLIAPMVCGVATLVALKREFADITFLAHPSLGGLRIAPSVLLGKLFRLFGADAVIFPNHGGRFAYSREVCRAIASNNTQLWHGLKPSLPTPAGGMSIERTAEIVAEYGRDSMLLIGGALVGQPNQMAARSAEFVEAVAAASEAIAI
ncbi:MAG: RuBisCO large subunit C-terminal-like domain-containing protein [Burkholderiaceae bacterium]